MALRRALVLACSPFVISITLAACDSEVTRDPSGSGGADAGSGNGSSGSKAASNSSSNLSSSSGSAACPFPGSNGTHLVAISLRLDPLKAFVLDASLLIVEGPMGLVGTLSLQPLSAADQMTPVCEPIEIEDVSITTDGSLLADFGTVTLCGAANPISGADVTTSLVLDGTLCTGTLGFACGDVAGAVVIPIPDFDLTGSTFTMQKYQGAKPTPLINCEKVAAEY